MIIEYPFDCLLWFVSYIGSWKIFYAEARKCIAASCHLTVNASIKKSRSFDTHI